MSSILEPGDEKTALRKYFCLRPECGKEIKVMAFRNPNDYCSIICEKLDADSTLDISSWGKPK